MHKPTIIKALFLIITGIILGAFAAHYFKTILPTAKLQSFEVGVKYQLYIGIILLILGFSIQYVKSVVAFNGLFLGNVLFSYSIYILTFTEMPIGMITPIGGLIMIVSLCFILIQVIKYKQTQVNSK